MQYQNEIKMKKQFAIFEITRPKPVAVINVANLGKEENGFVFVSSHDTIDDAENVIQAKAIGAFTILPIYVKP